MRIFKFSFFLICFLLITMLGFSQHGNHILPDKATTDIVKIALDHTYNFEYKAAEKLCNEISLKYPKHPGPDFMRALNVYWQMMSEDTYKENAPRFIAYLEKSVILSKAMLEKNENDIEAVFFKLAAECYLTLYYSEKEELSTTIGHAKKMYGTVKKAFEIKTALNEFYFPTGIYNYYVVMYPETHPIFKPFMFLFMKGTKEAGFKDLDYAWNNSIFCKMECGAHIANIYIKYEGTPLKADTYTKVLHERYPQNLFFTIRRAEVLLAKKEYKEAEQLAHQLYKSGKNFYIACACVLYGLLYQDFFKDQNTAKLFFTKAIQLFKNVQNPEIDYLSIAYAGLGRYYHAIGDEKMATNYYTMCKEIAEYILIVKEATAYLAKK